jgi:transposase
MSSKAEWTKRVEAWTASGKSAREFCEGRDYSAKSLQWWGWHLRKARHAKGVRDEHVRFARVVRKRGAVAAAGAAGLVVHVGGARVEVGTAVDRAALAAVLDVLLATAGGRP